MCYFLALGIDPGQVRPLEEHRPAVFHLQPNVNPSIQRQFGSRTSFWVRSPSMCECGLCSALCRHETMAAAAFRQKRKRQGWSAQKIEHALNSKRQARQETAADTWAGEFVAWMAAAVREAGEVLLLAHDYRGGPDTEEVGVRKAMVIVVDDLAQGRASLPGERLVHLVASASA
jgi:hypothetical protein